MNESTRLEGRVRRDPAGAGDVAGGPRALRVERSRARYERGAGRSLEHDCEDYQALVPYRKGSAPVFTMTVPQAKFGPADIFFRSVD